MSDSNENLLMGHKRGLNTGNLDLGQLHSLASLCSMRNSSRNPLYEKLVERQSRTLWKQWNPDPSVVQPIASHYTG
jgi:hypothetical protein